MPLGPQMGLLVRSKRKQLKTMEKSRRSCQAARDYCVQIRLTATAPMSSLFLRSSRCQNNRHVSRDNEMTETWKDIPDYEGLYQVSNTGKVRSKKKRRVNGVSWSKRKIGVEKKQRLDKDGYYLTTLSKEGIKTTFHIHELVCFAFIGPRPKGLVVRHLDHSKTNNIPSNLCWGTPQENSADRFNNPKDVRYNRQKK